MKHFLLSAALGVATVTAATAQQPPKPRELSAPIVALTRVLAQNADTLELSAEQRADLTAWLDTMPAKRKALEAEAMTARAALRAAILAGTPTAEREALAQMVGAYETRLMMMRSTCTDHWRAVLRPEQFAKLLTLAGLH